MTDDDDITDHSSILIRSDGLTRELLLRVVLSVAGRRQGTGQLLSSICEGAVVLGNVTLGDAGGRLLLLRGAVQSVLVRGQRTAVVWDVLLLFLHGGGGRGGVGGRGRSLELALVLRVVLVHGTLEAREADHCQVPVSSEDTDRGQ